MAISMLFTVAVALVATLANVHAQQYTSPAGCTLGNCDLYFKWEMANGFMNMTMSGRTSGWIAIGYSSDQEMGGGDDMITAYIDGLGVPQVENRHAEGTRRTPIVDTPDVAALSGIEGSRSGDTVTVKFSRKLETGAGADVDLDMSTCPSVFLFFATGPGSNGAIQQHPNNGQSGAPRITDTTINVCATAVVSASSAQIRDKKLITHGALMIAGWLGLSTTASYFARYMKHLGPFWFSVHRNLQILVVIVVSISGIVIASANRDTPWSSHQKLGIAVFAFMIWQFLLGMFRNLISGYNAEDFKRTGFRGPRRVYFNFLHRSTGYLLLPLSAAAVYTGMKLLDLDDDAWMLYWAWVGVVAAFIIISEFMALRAARFSQGGKPVPDSSRSLARHAAALFAALMFALAATIIVFVAALA